MNLKTIAKMAGVSTVTVSNVMNGKYNRASKETIERVLKIIEENDYRPSAMARSLTMKQSRIIGVVVSHLGENDAFSVSPYDSQILAYLERYIRGQGYYTMLRCVERSSEVVPIFPPGMLTALCYWVCLPRMLWSSRQISKQEPYPQASHHNGMDPSFLSVRLTDQLNSKWGNQQCRGN